MKAIFTKHASKRLQQRGIRREAIDLALKLGRKVQAGNGELKFILTQQRIVRLYGHVPRSIERFVGLTVIAKKDEEGFTVITAYRKQRKRRVRFRPWIEGKKGTGGLEVCCDESFGGLYFGKPY